MKDVCTRLLKVLWFFNLAFAGGIILIGVLSTLTGDIQHDIDDLATGLGFFICIVPVLMIMQYILLGSFRPTHLLNKESRYPR